MVVIEYQTFVSVYLSVRYGTEYTRMSSCRTKSQLILGPSLVSRIPNILKSPPTITSDLPVYDSVGPRSLDQESHCFFLFLLKNTKLFSSLIHGSKDVVTWLFRKREILIFIPLFV